MSDRPHYLPAPHFFNLNHACMLINAAYASLGCYLVGSSLKSKDYRDVDVRLILSNKEYDRLFRDAAGTDWLNPFWSLQCTTIALWLRRQTDLPIDFQIQRMTDANERYSGKRNALGVFMDYPGERPSDVGDHVRDAPIWEPLSVREARKTIEDWDARAPEDKSEPGCDAQCRSDEYNGCVPWCPNLAWRTEPEKVICKCGYDPCQPSAHAGWRPE